MAKAAIIMLTRNAAIEYASTGVRINAHVTWIDVVAWAAGLVGHGPHRPSRLRGADPQGRLGLTGGIADAVVWLASDESSYVNGTVIPVDGGVWAKLASPSTEGPDSPRR